MPRTKWSKGKRRNLTAVENAIEDAKAAEFLAELPARLAREVDSIAEGKQAQYGSFERDRIRAAIRAGDMTTAELTTLTNARDKVHDRRHALHKAIAAAGADAAALAAVKINAGW